MPLPPAAKKRRTTTPQSPNPFLLQIGRKRESIVGDGNCYFRTVSKAAFGTKDRHLALRLQIVNFMAEYKSVFEMFNVFDLQRTELQTFFSYLYATDGGKVTKKGNRSTILEAAKENVRIGLNQPTWVLVSERP